MKPDYEESIENEDNIASDELLYMEEMEQARIIEQAALAEIEDPVVAFHGPALCCKCCHRCAYGK